FALRDKHVIHGSGGAARNWAEGRTRFIKEVSTKFDMQKQIAALSPEPVRGFCIPFAMGGGTGSSFASGFIQYIKKDTKEHATIATLGLLPEFGWDPIIFEAAAINIVMNLEHQIKYSDCSILFSNKTLRLLAHKFEKAIPWKELLSTFTKKKMHFCLILMKPMSETRAVQRTLVVR